MCCLYNPNPTRPKASQARQKRRSGESFFSLSLNPSSRIITAKTRNETACPQKVFLAVKRVVFRSCQRGQRWGADLYILALTVVWRLAKNCCIAPQLFHPLRRSKKSRGDIQN